MNNNSELFKKKLDGSTHINSYGRKDYSLQLSYQAHVVVPERLFMGKCVKNKYSIEIRTRNI